MSTFNCSQHLQQVLRKFTLNDMSQVGMESYTVTCYVCLWINLASAFTNFNLGGGENPHGEDHVATNYCAGEECVWFSCMKCESNRL